MSAAIRNELEPTLILGQAYRSYLMEHEIRAATNVCATRLTIANTSKPDDRAHSHYLVGWGGGQTAQGPTGLL